MVTSRKERDIESSLENLAHDIIPLQNAIVNDYIRKYIRHRMSANRRLKRWHDSEVQAEIEVSIMQGAHGMYIHSLIHYSHYSQVD